MSIKRHLEGKLIQLKKIYGQKKAGLDKRYEELDLLAKILKGDLEAIEAVENEIANLDVEVPSAAPPPVEVEDE